MSAPPTHAPAPAGCPSATAPNTAVQNGSTVETIAVRTGPSRASPDRNAANASTVQTSASVRIAPHARAGSTRSGVPPAAAP